MRLSQRFTQESDKEESIRCDICGDTYLEEESPFNPSAMIHSEHALGYDSTLLEDLQQQNMNICEKCLYDWVKSHGIYPSVIPPSDDKKQKTPQ